MILKQHNRTFDLEALSVDDGWSRLIVFLLGDPHLLEGGEGSKNGSSNPDGVLSLWWSDDLDSHGGRSESSQLLLHSVSDSREHGGSSRKDDVSVKILSDVDVALHDGVEGGLVDSSRLHSEEGRLEESLRASESLVSDGDDLSVRKFVGLLECCRGCCGCHLLLKVKSDVAELLLDVSHDLSLCGGGERVSSLGEDLHEVIGEISSCEVESHDCVRESISFIDWHSVGNSVTRVEDDSGGTSRSIEGEDSLDSDIHCRGVEGLEHDLGHAFSVGLWVQRSLSQ